MITPRVPTREEIEQLAQAQEVLFGCPSEEAMDRVLTMANIAVFDDYITECPDYSGKVMLVLWDTSPSVYETYVWSAEGRLRYMPQDQSVQVFL